MASKIVLASVLILMLLALGESSLGYSEESVQELNTWDKDYQLENMDTNFDMAENEIQSEDTDDTTEVEEGLYEEESDSEVEKRALASTPMGTHNIYQSTSSWVSSPSPSLKTTRIPSGSQSTHQTISFAEPSPSPSMNTTKRCGPDVTSWLVGQMNRNMNHIEIKRCRSWYRYFAWPRCLLEFAGLVGNGKPWDFKRTQAFRRGPCPTLCPRTVTLCGQCVNYDVPGNIHYGWVGRAATIRRWLLLYAADRVQKGGVDDPRDQVAITIGMDLWDVPRKRSHFCREVLSKIRSLNLDGTSGCSICSLKY